MSIAAGLIVLLWWLFLLLPVWLERKIKRGTRILHFDFTDPSNIEFHPGTNEIKAVRATTKVGDSVIQRREQ